MKVQHLFILLTFVVTGSTKSVAVDECADGTHHCDVNAECNDTDCGYNCTCKPGYEGDGFCCTDKDECAANDTCGEGAYCTNQDGSFTCTCDPGYTGDGVYCNKTENCYPCPLVKYATINCHFECDLQSGNAHYDCNCIRQFNQMNGSDLIRCVDGQWEKAPTCEREPPCGVQRILPITQNSSANYLSFIIEGEEATPNSWPWMVSIEQYWFNTSTGKYFVDFCGGSLINRQWIISAAHCFSETGGGHAIKLGQTIKLGNHNRSREDKPYEVEVDEAARFPHKEFGKDPKHPKNYDIILLKLTKPVRMNAGVSHVCLPPAGVDYEAGRECYTLGWGVTTPQGGELSETLQQLMVPLIARDTCNGAGWYNGRVTENMVCAGYKEGKKDSCQGDSGGPLLCRCKKDGPWMLTGVTSWGDGCAREKRPGIYTNVAMPMIKGWIEKTILNN